MIHYLGHKEHPVSEAIRQNKNALKSWKYGYDAEHDVVIISKDGTLGEIYSVNGLCIGFPEVPKDRKQIINWDKTESNQKWKRKELPKGLTHDTQYDAEHEDYIKEEIKRRKEGVWIFIKGEKIYLTGLSYYLYQWCYLDEGYADFRLIQNELMLFWEACKADNRCYGVAYVKNRRFGWSTICDAELLYSGTTHKDKKLGIISKTNEDAKEMFDIAFSMFKKLPPFFQPSWDEQTLSRILLRKTKKSDKDIDDGLDTYIRSYSTALNSMDGGKKVFRSAIDECGKFPKDVPFARYWSIVKTSHRQGTRIVGKSMVGSTVNALKKGGSEFKKVFEQSDISLRNENGQTPSGLYGLFISAELGLEGRYDTYGFSIVDDPKVKTLTDEGIYVTTGSRTYLDIELESKKSDPEEYNEQLRQFPRTVKHAFRDESNECAFNLNKIIEQTEHNEYESNHDDKGSDEIERGNLQWKNGVQDTEVVWKPDPENGKFWIKSGCHPPAEIRNKREKKFIHGILAWAPTASHIGTIGADPYNRTLNADGRGSKGSLSLSTRYNTSSLPNEEFIVEYIDRAKKVEYFFEDALMLCVYYSVPLLGELSNEAFLKHIKNRGYRHFSMNNPFKTYKQLSHTEKEIGGAPAQDSKIADQQFYAVEAYISDRVGVARESNNRPLGTMGSMVFNRTLEQWKEVDLANRTKYDAYISSSLSLVGNQKQIIKQDVIAEKRRNPFKKYDNSGTFSKAI
ncbi:hypothetical protein [Thalassobellus suaedae]|uniref:Uncharacterized protein n=1 Tax=Thalassobellus suaedae TaxID=3074124 RepID=A0ABY9XVQ5_9FLAO|nr:hypothetical protein RHP51_04940 [Flavobacteriaceae bacterium HL-DH14]